MRRKNWKADLPKILGNASEATLALSPVSFCPKKDVDLQRMRQSVGQTTNEVTCKTNQRTRKRKKRSKSGISSHQKILKAGSLRVHAVRMEIARSLIYRRSNSRLRGRVIVAPSGYSAEVISLLPELQKEGTDS